MFQHIGRGRRGFTLIELAIVLTISGLLFVGLWRLLSGGNQQTRDQAAASQQQQLIAAVKSYLSSSQGSSVFLNSLLLTGTGKQLPLPTVNSGGVCTIAPPTLNSFCSYLPPGFINTTPNSYGQTYTIMVERNDNSPLLTIPSTYSFMIVTGGGDTIPDTSGGRISAYIGGDGGFLYTGNVCGAPTNLMACGAYGTWTSSTAAYTFPGTVSGHIASRTFVSPTADNQFPWLARQPLPPDPTYSWNTMTTDLYMGPTSQQTAPSNSNIYMAPYAGAVPTTGGSTIFLAGGKINMEGGQIIGSDTSNISLSGSALTLNPLIQATNVSALGCPMNSPGAPASCPYAITTDSINVSNLVNAFSFYAQTFIYQSSDVRLKSNIHPITGALDDIMKLKPVSFTLKSNGKDGLGVIAQDLEKVYPQLVTKGEGMKSVNYDGLIGPLIESVQELKKENDDLRHELHAQQERQKELERKIELSKPAEIP